MDQRTGSHRGSRRGPRRALRIVLPALIGLGASSGCREFIDYNSGNLDFDPERPQIDEAPEVEPYAGDDEIVLLAQQRFPTGLDLHKKVIWRTCTPNGGVCHNTKEYPDLHTPANFASAFSAPCNVQAGEFEGVFDGCEQSGDRIRFSGYGFGTDEIEIGWVEFIPGEAEDYGDSEPPVDAPGLHIHLASPIPAQDGSPRAWGTVGFVRTFVNAAGEVQESAYASFDSTWWPIGDRTHIVGTVREYQVEDVQELVATGIVMGDANRNGVFGAHEGAPVSMLEPGDPVGSYLIGRMRGEMHGEPVPGSRMPLANPPLSVDEMLALFCLVEGFPADGDSAMLSGPIDYNRCSFSEDPADLNLLGDGVTWASRIKLIFEFNCGGCHNEDSPQGNLTLLGDGVYERLLQSSGQLSDMALIEPGDPDNSYLYLKLIGDDRITGLQMPYNPLTGEGSLSQAELSDIETWIINGAVEDE
ncbi:c-type cytochrome domain-containing protein [Paraliomyxa miuraensis]|uniref:c-type cytochrome domain-containing protein n=1 Tax=Paraliomyxa miuraensis TaxID=376150 RepID=UPI00225847A8|nr:c-type cytochrome domain-containing protein [Paraliomyxa miuraensis]MCX4246268.1 hypothetical protein [Paraliomyxa miuraensis]